MSFLQLLLHPSALLDAPPTELLAFVILVVLGLVAGMASVVVSVLGISRLLSMFEDDRNYQERADLEERERRRLLGYDDKPE